MVRLARVKSDPETSHFRFDDWYEQAYPWAFYPMVRQMWRMWAGGEDKIPYTQAMAQFLWDINTLGGAKFSHGANAFLINRQTAMPHPGEPWSKRKAEAVVSGSPPHTPNWLHVIDINNGSAMVECQYFKAGPPPRSKWEYLIHQLWAIGRDRSVVLPGDNDVVLFPLYSKLQDSTGRGYYFLPAWLLDFRTEVPVQPSQPQFTNQNMINAFYKAFGVLGYWYWLERASLTSLIIGRQDPYTGPVVSQMGLPETQWRKLQAVLLGNPLPEPKQTFVFHTSKLNGTMKIWNEYKTNAGWDYGEKVLGYLGEGDEVEILDWDENRGGFYFPGMRRVVPRTEAMKFKVVRRASVPPDDDFNDRIKDKPGTVGWVQFDNPEYRNRLSN